MFWQFFLLSAVEAQTAGVWKPPLGTMTKSRHTQSFRQQKSPTVCATLQTNPRTQRLSLVLFLSRVSASAQSSSEEQSAVQVEVVSVAMPGSSAGRRQMRDGHSRPTSTVAVDPAVDVPPSTVRSHCRPMCLFSQEELPIA